MAKKMKIMRIHTPSKAALGKAESAGAAKARKKERTQFQEIMSRLVTTGTGAAIGVVERLWSPGRWARADWTVWIGGIGAAAGIFMPKLFTGSIGRPIGDALVGFATVAAYKLGSPDGALGGEGRGDLGGMYDNSLSPGVTVTEDVVSGEYSNVYTPQ